MDCVRRGVFPAGGLLSPRASPSRERGPCDVASETTTQRGLPVAHLALRTQAACARGRLRGRCDVASERRPRLHTSPCAPRRPVREGVCAVDIGHDAALRGVRSSRGAGAMVFGGRSFGGGSFGGRSFGG